MMVVFLNLYPSLEVWTFREMREPPLLKANLNFQSCRRRKILYISLLRKVCVMREEKLEKFFEMSVQSIVILV